MRPFPLRLPVPRRALALGLAALLLGGAAIPGAARADELRVVSSGGFAAALRALAPEFEKRTGHHLVLLWGPSMGETENAVPARLARGEKLDVLVMVGYSLNQLIEQGKVAPDSRAELARSGISVAVRAGAPHPDIATEDAVRRAMLAAPSVAWSDSASGVYIEREMLKHLGIAEQMRGKGRAIPAEPVGQVVARGEAALGFQQTSELKPIGGIDIVGPLPAPLQRYTVFSAGVTADSHAPQAARELVRFLASRDAAPAVVASGMEPAAH